MGSEPLSDVVSRQYETWVYPAPILDVPAWLTGNWQWFDPSHAHGMFWPDRDYWSGMDVLVAGCGTNQAALLAYTNPSANVVAIDVSQSSLDHSRYLADKYALKNLALHRLPVEEVSSLSREFDLILSTGVLHHLADPAVGMRALGECLRPDGVIAVMLYARYGRIGVEMMESIFRDMGLVQDEPSVLLVKEAIAGLASDHPVRSYLAVAPDLQFDGGLVDTFLHGRERSYTVEDCLALVASAGLVFQEWFLKSPYYAPPVDNAFYAAVAELPVEQQWSVMERINTRNGCHFFTACRPDRSQATYRLDFTTQLASDYIPSLRYRCQLEGNQLHRHDWMMPLDDLQVALVRLMDGQRTIGDIVDDASRIGTLPPWKRQDQLDLALAVCQSLWQLDFLSMGIRH